MSPTDRPYELRHKTTHEDQSLVERGTTWAATAIPRRSFLVRAGAAAVGIVGSIGLGLKNPPSALAECLEGNACGFSVGCYRRWVCGCSSVWIRYCPGTNGFAQLGYGATFDIQSPPSAVSGYRYGWAWGSVNARGFALESCLRTYSC